MYYVQISKNFVHQVGDQPRLVSISFRVGYFSLIHDVQFRRERTSSVSNEL
jgi:hypothetical protein